ncbi:MAG: RNA polymerase sigma factor, partial [Alphaproteobacteria bacterium]
MSGVRVLMLEQVPALRRYARALTGNREQADDLVQDTLARALSRLHLWRPAASIRPWLFTIMHNLFLNERRRSSRMAPMTGEPAEPAIDRADSRALLDDLDRALTQLPEDQRAAILLVGVEEMSYEDAARVLGIPIGTLMSRLSRGREQLRRLLDGDGRP